MLKLDNKNEDNTVKSVRDPKEASRKWTKKESSTRNGRLGSRDYQTIKLALSVNHEKKRHLQPSE